MIFLDSNIIVTFFADSHEHHRRSHSLVLTESGRGTILVVSPQVLGEAFRALTSPKAVEYPISPDEYLRLSEAMLETPNVQLVSPGRKAFTAAVQTAARLGVISHRIYDLLIYGTMLEHGITQLATFNETHFSGLPGIELVPLP